MLTKFYRLNEALEGADATAINNQIIDAIKATGYSGTPSQQWIAGAIRALQKSTSEHKHLVSMLHKYERLPPDEQLEFGKKFSVPTAKNIRALYKVLADNNLIDAVKKETGEIVYNWPSSEDGNDFKGKTDVLSEISRLVVASNAEKNKNNDVFDKTKKEIRRADQLVNDDEEAKLRANGYGKIFDVLQSMSESDIKGVSYITKVREYAKKHKTNYSQILKQQLERGGKITTSLHNFGFINDDGKLNNELISSFFKLFNSDPRLVFKINKNAKTLYDMLEKASADQAYVDNDTARELQGSGEEQQATQLMSQLTQKDIDAITRNQVFPERFKKMGLLDSRGRTNKVYAALQVMLKRKASSLGDVVQGTKDRTGRDEKTGRLEPSHPTNTGDTHARKLDDINRRIQQFSQFNKSKQA
jgi:hypothetical protein